MPVTKKGTIIGPSGPGPDYEDEPAVNPNPYSEEPYADPNAGGDYRAKSGLLPDWSTRKQQQSAFDRARQEREREEWRQRYESTGYGPAICGTSILIGGVLSCLSALYFISCL